MEIPLDLHVVLSLERKYRQRVDVMFTLNGVVINAHEVQGDMHAAVDKVLDKLEMRLSRYRDKVKQYREGKPKYAAAGVEEKSGPDHHAADDRCEAHGPGRSTDAAQRLGRRLYHIPRHREGQRLRHVQTEGRQFRPRRNNGKGTMNMKDVLKESCVIADLKGGTKKEVLTELASALKGAGLIQDVDEAVGVILEREKLGSTGIGEGVAIPHGKMKGIDRILCAFGRSKKGVDFDAVDGKPVHIFFLLLAPEDSAGTAHPDVIPDLADSEGPVVSKAADRAGRRQVISYADIVAEDKKFGG